MDWCVSEEKSLSEVWSQMVARKVKKAGALCKSISFFAEAMIEILFFLQLNGLEKCNCQTRILAVRQFLLEGFL